jgi:hypothetical protein
MSRVGKNPVALPDGVTVEIDGNVVKAKGKLGELSVTLTNDVKVEQEKADLEVKLLEERTGGTDGNKRNALHHPARAHSQRSRTAAPDNSGKGDFHTLHCGLISMYGRQRVCEDDECA